MGPGTVACQSAVSWTANPRGLRPPDGLPMGSRRYSRLAACGTTVRFMGSVHGLSAMRNAHEPGRFVWRPSTVSRFMRSGQFLFELRNTLEGQRSTFEVQRETINRVMGSPPGHASTHDALEPGGRRSSSRVYPVGRSGGLRTVSRQAEARTANEEPVHWTRYAVGIGLESLRPVGHGPRDTKRFAGTCN
jgi:hypothetical protein